MAIIEAEPKSKKKTKVVDANQKAVDALPLNSGMWRIKGIPGLYVRSRATSKSFMLQRRVEGDLVKLMLGPLTVKAAKERAMEEWGSLERKPARDGVITFETAVTQYMEAKPLAPKTRFLMKYNLDHYLKDLKGRSLADIGKDRAGVRALQQRITKNHGPATANQTAQLLSAVYRWCRKVQTDLPESPMVVVEKHRIKPRDWAYSADDLKSWWFSQVEEKDKVIRKGVSTLTPIKRAWWLTALFTGARKGSIEALKWADVDFGKKVMHFRVAKADRPYLVPISDALAEILTRYRANKDIPPSRQGWVFPSNVKEDAHIAEVKNIREGVGPAHRLRHTFRTILAQLGASPDQARMLMGHSMGGDVSRGYITSSLVVESLRPLANAVAERYVKIIGLAVE
jgi:integrase